MSRAECGVEEVGVDIAVGPGHHQHAPVGDVVAQDRLGSGIPTREGAFHVDHEEERGVGQLGGKACIAEGLDAVVDDKVREVVGGGSDRHRSRGREVRHDAHEVLDLIGAATRTLQRAL